MQTVGVQISSERFSLACKNGFAGFSAVVQHFFARNFCNFLNVHRIAPIVTILLPAISGFKTTSIADQAYLKAQNHSIELCYITSSLECNVVFYLDALINANAIPITRSRFRLLIRVVLGLHHAQLGTDHSVSCLCEILHFRDTSD